MKNVINRNLVLLPRSFRVWWGKVFLYMLGRMGNGEFETDIVLYVELDNWIKKGGEKCQS
jgi:hypothetical protein